MPMQGANTLLYGSDDRPPAGALLILTLQHAALVMVFMVYPVAIAQSIGLSPLQTGGFLAATLFACAVGTMVQALRPPWGSGQLGVLIPSPVMLPALMHAGAIGGLPLVAGFAWMLSASELVIARILPRLKVCFPPEVCGVVIIALGLAIAPTALMQFTGVTQPDASHIDPVHLTVASLTLVVVIGATLLGGGRLRLIAVGIGLVIGSVAGLLLGLLPADRIERLETLPWFGLPSLAWSMPKIDLMLLPIAVLLALIASVDNLGAQVGVQRLVDPSWKKIDFHQGSGSVQANAAGDFTVGLLAGAPVGLSSSHVGLMFATHTASRVIAPCTAALLVIAAFMPKLIEMLALIPRPVVGALIVYTAGYLIVSGMQLTQSRLLSDRRMFTVGLSLVVGLVPLALPGLKQGLPMPLQPLYESSLSMAAICAVLLTLVFRFGIQSRATLPREINPLEFDAVKAFFDRMGRQWGAHRDTIQRATRVTSEAVEALSHLDIGMTDVQCELYFDEDIVTVTLIYRGPALECPEARPSAESSLDSRAHLARVAGHLVRRSVDQLTQTRETDGITHRLILRFEP